MRDALILREGSSLADLPLGAKVGTASLRREAQLRRLRPDLAIGLLRGNVQTRLARVADGTFDATLLALAGLTRLGLAGQGHLRARYRHRSSPRWGRAPSPSRGGSTMSIAPRRCRLMTDAATFAAVTLERAFLAELDGSCRTPIAGLATVDGARIAFRGLLLSNDGTEAIETAREGDVADAARLGADAGREVRARAPAHMLA